MRLINALFAVSTLIFACASAFARDAESIVRLRPDHPMADVLGYVIERRDTSIANEGGIAGPPVTPTNMPGWPLNFSLQRPQEGGVVVQADLDPQSEFLFSTGKTVHLVNHNGSALPGWPKVIPTGTALAGGPSFGDLDGDGNGEIVVAAENWPNGSVGWVYAYNADGTSVPGFPAMSAGDHSRSPVVVDLDDDGDCEIIIGERQWPTGRVYVFAGNGSLLPGWPQSINHVPASCAGAADLDDDGVKEIFYESYNSLYAFRLNGTLVAGWPFTPATGDVFSYSAPTFADVDGDNLPEIAVGGHALSGQSHVFLLKGNGTLMAGWPKAVSWWVYAPVTFADVDGDAAGDLEIIVGDQVLSGSPADFVYGWHHTGAVVAGFPIGPINAINAQVAVADIDGNGDAELFWDDNTTSGAGEGKLLGYHHTGQPINGWPLTTQGTTFFNTIAIDDADGDGDLEMLVPAGTTSSPFVTTVYLWSFPAQVNRADVQMAMFKYDAGRSGQAPSPLNPADINGDGEVDVDDLLAVITQWGPCPVPPAACPANIATAGSSANRVDVDDLLMVITNWGS